MKPKPKPRPPAKPRPRPLPAPQPRAGGAGSGKPKPEPRNVIDKVKDNAGKWILPFAAGAATGYWTKKKIDDSNK